MIRNKNGNSYTDNEFTIDLIRRIRILEREVSRLSTKDPGSGVITGLTLDHLNLGTATGATTGQLHASSHIQTDTQFISLVATGTAPIVVSSTTLVTNLNADLLDGLSTATSGSNAHVVTTDSAGDTSIHRLTLTQATGSSPLVVSSTTIVTNLNADLLDGLNTATSGSNAHVVITDSAGDTSLHNLTITQLTGTAPLTISSTTLVTNLNADLLDGLNSATSGSTAHIVATDANGDTSFHRLTLTQATGSSPLVVSSTTIVTNLNADLLDSLDTSSLGLGIAYVPITDSAGNLSLLSLGVNTVRDAQFQVDIGGNLRAQGWIVGKHAIQLADAVMICHYDGALPYNNDFTGTLTGHRSQIGTATGGVIFRSGKFLKCVQVPEATTNLITNPSFETNTTSWAGFSSATISRVTTDGMFGTCSLKIVTPGSTSGGAQYIHTSSTQGTYVTSCFIKAFGTADVGKTFDLYMRFSYSDATTTDATLRVTLTTDWQLMTVTAATNGAKTLSSVLIFIRDALAQASSISVLVDGVQLEIKAYRTPYSDGSLGNGHAWTGTAHASTSTRTAGSLVYSAVQIPPSGSISVWVYTTALMSANGNSRWIADGGSAAGIRLFVSTADDLTFTVGGVNRVTYGLTDGNFLVNTWHHIVATWDQVNSQSILYIDGAQVGSTGTYAVPVDDAGGWEVGNTAASAQWPGFIDDFALTSSAMAAAQVRAVYESNAPVFAETSTWTWATPTQRVFADANGLWVIDSASLAVFGVASVNTLSWGGQTLDIGDVLIGRGTSYVLWDNSAATLYVAGSITATTGTIGGWTIGATTLTSGGATAVVLDSTIPGVNITISPGNQTRLSPNGLMFNVDTTTTPPNIIWYDVNHTPADGIAYLRGRIAMSSGFTSGHSLQMEVFPDPGGATYGEAMVGVRSANGALGIRHYTWWDPGTSTAATFGVYGVTISGGVITPVTMIEFVFNNAASSQNRTILSNAAVTLNTPAWATGVPRVLGIGPGAYTNCTASTELMDVYFAFNRSVQFATGAKTTQRSFVVDVPTFTAVGATTISDAATVAIVGAPIASTNITITRTHALWVQGGMTTLAGGLNVGTATTAATGQVLSTNSQNSAFVSIFTNTNAGASASVGIQAISDTVTANFRAFSAAAGGGARLNITSASGYIIFGTTTNDHVDFYTNNAEVARFTGTGTLLVGKTTVAGTDAVGNVEINGRFGCNGAQSRAAAASGGAAPAGGTGATAGAYDTAAHRDALITLVNNIRTALVNNGIMS